MLISGDDEKGLTRQDERRPSLQNNTAGVREREDASRTREAGTWDEIQAKARVARAEGVEVILKVNAQQSAVRSIAWLGGTRSPPE